MIYRFVTAENAQRLRAEGWDIYYWIDCDSFLAERDE